MSDYLSTLIARTHNLTEVIQPRLAALFEPSPPVDGPGTGHFPAVQRLDVAPMSDTMVPGALTPAWPLPYPPLEDVPAPQPSVPDRSVHLTAPGQPLESASPRSHLSITDQAAVSNTSLQYDPPRSMLSQATTSSAAGTTPPHRPAEPSLQARLDTLRIPLVTPAPPPATVPPVPSATVAPQQARLEPPHVRMGVGQRTAPDAPLPFTNTPALPPPSSIQAARSSMPTMAVDESHMTPYATPTQSAATTPEVVRPPESVLQSRTPRLAAPVLGTVHPHVTPHVQPAVPMTPATPSIPPPTIRVTIGRIEVRALIPPAPIAPRRRPAQSGPTLSLDDYLKQRPGGQR